MSAEVGAGTYGAIVVLGARVHPGGVASDALRYRVQTGIAHFRAGAAPLLVFSGGSPRGSRDARQGRPTEAEVARRLAQAAGVPGDACLLEEASRTTWENAAFVAPLLRARGLHRVLVVTDAYHLYRALRCFWTHGLDAEGAASYREDGSLFVPQRRLRALSREAASLLRRPALLLARRPDHERRDR